MAKSKGISEELERRLSNAARRNIKGLLINTKMAEDAIYSSSRESVKWLTNAQVCLLEARELLQELSEYEPERKKK